jgi:tetratricopeptide (TPR) repeat protein
MIKGFVLQILGLLISLISFAQRIPEVYYRAQALMDQNQFSEAIYWLDSALVKSSNNPNLWVKRGEAHFQSGEFQKAIEDFKNAESIRNGIASYWLARSYAMINDTTNTFMELKRHLTLPVKEIEATILMDTAFNGLKQTLEWKKLWLNDWYTPYERMIADVAYHFSRNRWNDAIDLLNQRIEGRTARHQLYAMRGEAYYNINSYRAAEADFLQALKKSRRNHSYMAWYAKTLMAQGKSKKAVSQLNRAIDQSGGEPSYFKLRAQALAGIDDYQSAISDIQHYLSYYPNCIQGIELFAVFAMESGRNIDALFQLGKLIKANPNEALYYFLRGRIYMKSQNWTVAEIDFSKAISLEIDMVDAYMHRGQCNINLGNKNEACNDWKNALKLGKFEAQELIYKHCR